MLNCSVSEPHVEQESSKDAFVSYLVSTETDLPSFQSQHLSVRRRFTDFVYLYRLLTHDYPSCIIPPLPDKHKMMGRFGTEFTSKRSQLLSRFLSRLADHPLLSRCPTFLVFLEAPDWNVFMKHRPLKSDRVLDGIQDALLNAFTKVSHIDKRFTDFTEEIDRFDDDLLQLERLMSRLVRLIAQLGVDYAAIATHINRLRTIESSLEHPFLLFEETLQQLNKLLDGLAHQVDVEYVTSLHDTQAYIANARTLLKRREQKQLDVEALNDYISRATAERDHLEAGGGRGFLHTKMEEMMSVDHEQARQGRMKKLDGKIEELKFEATEAKRYSDAMDEQVHSETATFNRAKMVELRVSLRNLCDMLVKFYADVIQEWERIEQALT